jgi:hypothetical protein
MAFHAYFIADPEKKEKSCEDLLTLCMQIGRIFQEKEGNPSHRTSFPLHTAQNAGSGSFSPTDV